jgi:hypothetical protein
VLVQLGEHPEQEGRVQARAGQQLVGGEDVDDALLLARTTARRGGGLHEVGDVEHRFAEEPVAALGVDLHQAALDRADARRADVAVAGLVLRRVVGDVLQHRAQVLEVEQQQAVVVGDLEDELEDAFLRLVEVEHAREQQRPHVAHRRADGMAGRRLVVGEHVPQRRRAGRRRRRLDAALLQDRRHLRTDAARLGDAGQVALDVGHEHRNALAAEVLGERLQGHRLAGAGGAGDEAVPVRHARQEEALGAVAAGEKDRFGHDIVRAGRRRAV